MHENARHQQAVTRVEQAIGGGLQNFGMAGQGQIIVAAQMQCRRIRLATAHNMATRPSILYAITVVSIDSVAQKCGLNGRAKERGMIR